MNYSKLTRIATLAATKAGELLTGGFETTYRIEKKEGKHNLVTEYDIKSQKLIIQTIRSHFPDHHFLAEEDEVTDRPSDTILWIIDPLDGTVNFAHGIPFFAVSIAAMQGNEIVSGAILNPILGELFTAEKGTGAKLNGKTISVSKQSNLADAFLASGFPYNVDENPLGCIERFGAFIRQGLPIRRIGVAALDLAYVASGRFDAFWEVSLQPWDMAAGKLIVEEAGGKVSHYDGSEHKIFGNLHTLASNSHLHEDMLDQLKGDLL